MVFGKLALGAGKRILKSKKVRKVAGKAIGAITGLKFGAKKRRRTSFSITKYQKKLIKAKLDAKLMRTKLSGLRGL